MSEEKKACCPDCGVSAGDEHEPGCDIERCPECGHQRLSCGCETDRPSLPWNGIWPGLEECAEFGWYSRWVDGNGWVPCEKDDDGAGGDLNRLTREGVWDASKGRFVRPKVKLTEDEYVKSGGQACPVCKSDEKIFLGDPEIEGSHVISEASCGECGAKWNEVYILVGYSDVRDADGNKLTND